MPRTLRFAAALVVGLALVTWAASVIVHQTTSDWFEKDIRLRSLLAVSGARKSLLAHWSENRRGELQGILLEITRDERIMAAAACGPDSALLTKTAEFPSVFTCEAIGPKLHAASGSSAWTAWHDIAPLPRGKVHVSAVPILDGEKALGFMVLVHDLSFVEGRDANANRFLLLVFGFLALAASAVTVLAARWSWHNWSEGLRMLLRGEAERPEFRPFLHDVRELVDRVVGELGGKDDRGRGAAAEPRPAHGPSDRHHELRCGRIALLPALLRLHRPALPR